MLIKLDGIAEVSETVGAASVVGAGEEKRLGTSFTLQALQFRALAHRILNCYLFQF